MPDSTPAAASRVVFLSYAREDTDAARRVADALRGFGVEVWFDQNELRGGDVWDGKIKKQIRECALFLAVISATTRARGEGYFRREWKLAVERTHDMSASRAFLVPVVIDDTAESDAEVPEEFMRVQWTRLPLGAPTSQFVEQIKRLLASTGVAPASSRQSSPNAGKMPALPKPRPSAWMWPVVAVVAIGVVAFFLTRKSEPPAAPPKAVTETKTASTPLASLAPLAPEKSIAVLPFANMSPDKDNEFFADGVHEDVITNLAKIRDLKVISRTSVLAYRDPASRNLKRIAAELGVATVLEGSVRRVGTKVRVTAQLIDARTDEHLWAETYDRDLTDVFTIQSSLATEIAAALKANFTVGERALVAAPLTQNTEAYELYLRARALAENTGIVAGAGRREAMDQVISLHEQAVAKDPAFAAAYAQLAYLNGRMYWYESLDPAPARRERAKAALDAAVRIAPDRPETRLALGAYAYYCDNDWSRALVEFHTAEAGLPNDAQLNYFIALTERRLGHFSESVMRFKRSLELNPRDYICYGQFLPTLNTLRHFAAERDGALHGLTFFPNDPALLYYEAEARLELDRDAGAFFRTLATLRLASDDPSVPSSDYNLAIMRGDFAAAERALTVTKQKTISGLGSLINDPIARHRALVAFLRGDRDTARKFAEEAIAYYQSRSWTPRQTGAVKLGIAVSQALAGRGEEAVKLAHEAYEWQLANDVFTARAYGGVMAQIYFVLDRQEDVLDALRETMHDVCGAAPERVRLSPTSSKIKDDPRFEEILKLAKPL